MSNFKLKYHLFLMRADFVLSFVSITNVVFLLFVAQVYRYLVLGVDLEFKYANKAAGIILPAIWNEQISPMLIWIPIAMIADFFLKRLISYQRDS
jgi:hypothetical protein